MAAQIKVCSPFRLLRTRSLWIVGFVLSLTSTLLPASASPRGFASASVRYVSAFESLDSADSANVKSQESSSKPQESSSKPQDQESSSKPETQQQPDQSQQPQPAPQQPAPQPTQSPLEN